MGDTETEFMTGILGRRGSVRARHANWVFDSGV
jgi:hypothetical protein